MCNTLSRSNLAGGSPLAIFWGSDGISVRGHATYPIVLEISLLAGRTESRVGRREKSRGFPGWILMDIVESVDNMV